VSEDEAEFDFLGLDDNKGPGLDGITPAILKRFASVVKVPLTFVFNLSLSVGVFPAIWKESFVVSLFKSGDKHDVSCYCGISILFIWWVAFVLDESNTTCQIGELFV
jgi:hypothetical protein